MLMLSAFNDARKNSVCPVRPLDSGESFGREVLCSASGIVHSFKGVREEKCPDVVSSDAFNFNVDLIFKVLGLCCAWDAP